MEEDESLVRQLGDIAEVSGTEGWRALSEAGEAGDIPKAQVDKLQGLFQSMFKEFKRAQENVPQLEGQLGSLEKQLEEEKLKIKSRRGLSGEEGEGVTQSSLREDLQQAKAEVALSLEREQVLLLEMNELQRQRDRLRINLDALDLEKAKEIEPQLREIRKNITEISAMLEEEKLRFDDAHKEKMDELFCRAGSLTSTPK